MNLLPFVFTFLLLLTLLTSFMFSSAVRIIREKEVVAAEHEAYLTLLSKQNKDRFNKKRPSSKKQQVTDSPKKSKAWQKRFANKHHQDFRDIRMGYEGSKVNLWPMVHGNNPRLQSALQTIVARLIEALYGVYPFYTTSGKKDIAHTIVQAMVDQKIESFGKLQLSDPDIDRIYYTLLKGTNTAYPPLSEYCRLDNVSKPPIHFRFTSKPVIRAVFGEPLAEQIFALEKKNHAANSKCHALTKKELLEFTKTHSSHNLITELFYFESKDKGLPQISFKKDVKIRAFHEAKSEAKTT